VLSSLPRHYPTFDLWLRLYAHALLRESLIFPGVGLSDKYPEYSRSGFADIWKGDYRGQTVCIKVIRSRARIPLVNIQKVCDSFNLSTTCSACFIPDIPSRKPRGEARSSSEHSPRYRCFGHIVPTLHHEPMDARWEHHPVHPDEAGCESAGIGTRPPTLKIGEDNPLTTRTTARTSVPRSHVSPWVGYYSW